MAQAKISTAMRRSRASGRVSSPTGLARGLAGTIVTTYGHNFATANTLFRDDAPGKVGRQEPDLAAHARRLEGRRGSCRA